MFWYKKTLVEFDLVQHQIGFAGSSDVRLCFASPNITCPGKTNLMLDSVSSNKCLMLSRRGSVEQNHTKSGAKFIYCIEYVEKLDQEICCKKGI